MVKNNHIKLTIFGAERTFRAKGAGMYEWKKIRVFVSRDVASAELDLGSYFHNAEGKKPQTALSKLERNIAKTHRDLGKLLQEV